MEIVPFSGGKDGGDRGGREPAAAAGGPPQGIHQGRLEQGQVFPGDAMGLQKLYGVRGIFDIKGSVSLI